MGGSLLTITFSLTPSERSPLSPCFKYHIFYMFYIYSIYCAFFYNPLIRSSQYLQQYSLSPPHKRALLSFHTYHNSIWSTFCIFRRFPIPPPPSIITYCTHCTGIWIPVKNSNNVFVLFCFALLCFVLFFLFFFLCLPHWDLLVGLISWDWLVSIWLSGFSPCSPVFLSEKNQVRCQNRCRLARY